MTRGKWSLYKWVYQFCGVPPVTRQELLQRVSRQERELRIYRVREKEWDERYSGPADIEGVGGHPAVITYRDKNFAQVCRLIDGLPHVVFWGPTPENPTAPIIGYEGAVAFARVHVAAAIDAVWVAGPQHAIQVRDYHRVKSNLTPPFVDRYIRSDRVGFYSRVELKQQVESLAFAPSVRLVFDVSQETEVQPVEAERQGY